jgi:hypothetical protein
MPYPLLGGLYKTVSDAAFSIRLLIGTKGGLTLTGTWIEIDGWSVEMIRTRWRKHWNYLH